MSIYIESRRLLSAGKLSWLASTGIHICCKFMLIAPQMQKPEIMEPEQIGGDEYCVWDPCHDLY
jgi:hypothetical protein